MKNELKFGDLKPRAIAALLALRTGPKTANQIGTAIGDGNRPVDRAATADLLVDMQRPGMDLVAGHEGKYYLDHDGLGWLQSQGLDAVKEARIWSVVDGVSLARRALERGSRAAGSHVPDAVEPHLAVDANVDAFGHRTVRRG